ncbi:MAG: hypothetical protein H7837_07180 [Magnetococcus sp. MYC-9]
MANITSAGPHLPGIKNASMLDNGLSSLKEGLGRLSGGLKIRMAGHEELPGLETALPALGDRLSNDRLSTDVQSLNQARMQVNDGIAMTQVASAGLDDIHTDLQQLQKLVVASRSGTLSESDRQAMQEQARKIQRSIDQKVHSTRYNGVPLLASTKAILLQTGIDTQSQTTIQLPDLTRAFTPIELTSGAGQDAASLSLQKEQDLVGSLQTQMAAKRSELLDTLNTLESWSPSQVVNNGRIGAGLGVHTVADQIASIIREHATMAFQVQANQSAVRVQQLL